MNFLVTQMLLCLLVAVLLGMLLGWWLGRRRCQERIVRLDEKWRRKLEARRKERETLRQELATCGEELASCRSHLEGRLRREPVPMPVAAVELDDLKRIEGIGPKIEGLLNAAGIMNLKQLAEVDVSSLRSVLDAAGSHYRIHDPATWPKQASLAADSARDELAERQNRRQGGLES